MATLVATPPWRRQQREKEVKANRYFSRYPLAPGCLVLVLSNLEVCLWWNRFFEVQYKFTSGKVLLRMTCEHGSETIDSTITYFSVSCDKVSYEEGAIFGANIRVLQFLHFADRWSTYRIHSVIHQRFTSRGWRADGSNSRINSSMSHPDELLSSFPASVCVSVAFFWQRQ